MIDLAPYPALSRPRLLHWRNGWTADMSFEPGMPPEHAIGNVSMVPFAGDRVVLLRSREYGFGLPGGTLDEGEAWRACLERELLEEVGAVVRSYTVFGALRFLAHHEDPYRPWSPHPESYRLLGLGEVEIVGSPTNPPGGETVEEVVVVPPDEAEHLMRTASDGAWREVNADIVRLAAALRAPD